MCMDGPIAFTIAYCRWLRFGPLMFWEELPMHTDGPIAFTTTYCRLLHLGPLHFLLLLPMASLWPIDVLGGASDAYRWAHRICSGLLPMALLWPIMFLGALPMHMGVPIAFSAACCQWLRLGPEIVWESLPIQRMGQLHFLLLLPMALVWPIHFLVGASDAQGWAHCIFGCCCRWLRFGPLTFWEALPMHTDGPIAFAAASCGWLHLGP